jgi:hypothetical protein
MQFAPYNKLQSTPNIIVDGKGTDTTVLTLSHWPKSGTPAELKSDLSAQIVFRYLARPDLHVQAEVASNNHFDEDGLIGLYALINPKDATKQREMLIDIAAGGDFGTYRFRQAARVVFVIQSYASPERSPLPADLFALPHADLCGALYEKMLPVLPDIVAHIEDYRSHWQVEDEFLERSEIAVSNREVEIEEVKELDLAVVSIPEVDADSLKRPSEALHSMAVHNVTKCPRVLYIRGNNYEFCYRYETWVQYMSRKLQPRVDLQPLAEMLSQAEGNKWQFDDVEALSPRLRSIDIVPAKMPVDQFRLLLESFLSEQPPAFDPYD